MSEYIKKNIFNIKILTNIVYNVLYIISVYQSSEFKFVHNNLVCSNIFLFFEDDDNPIVKIINFDNSSFNIKDKRFYLESSTQKEFLREHDEETFFNDLLTFVPEYKIELRKIKNNF